MADTRPIKASHHASEIAKYMTAIYWVECKGADASHLRKDCREHLASLIAVMDEMDADPLASDEAAA